MEALGGSLQSIAAAKAGIFKAGRPVVLAQQPHAEEVMPTLLGEARRLGCLVARAEEQVGRVGRMAGPGTGPTQMALGVLLGRSLMLRTCPLRLA